jgi:hypothetical protein
LQNVKFRLRFFHVTNSRLATIDPTDFQAVSHAVLETISLHMGYPFENLHIDRSIQYDLWVNGGREGKIVDDLQALFPNAPRPEAGIFRRCRDMVLWFYTGPTADIPRPE